MTRKSGKRFNTTYRTAVLTLLSHTSSAYHDLHRWKSNQQQSRNSTTGPSVHIAQTRYEIN